MPALAGSDLMVFSSGSFSTGLAHRLQVPLNATFRHQRTLVLWTALFQVEQDSSAGHTPKKQDSSVGKDSRFERCGLGNNSTGLVYMSDKSCQLSDSTLPE